jgi:hypothetical protein
MASIGPVTSATLRELGLAVDIAAKQFTIPGLIGPSLGSSRVEQNQELKRIGR